MVSIKSVVSKAKSAKGPKDLFSSGLVKLTILSFKDSKYDQSNGEYKVQFNPTQLDEAIKLEYMEKPPQGSTNADAKFKHLPPSELKLKLTLDGTGVTGQNGSTGKSGKFGLSADEFSVADEIEAFKKATCNYNGSTHDVPYVKVVWGSYEFKGRLKALNISHVLFKSDGKPVRSTLDATFVSALDLKTQALEADKQSPDLTHVRTVQVGDTLPLMCQGIYNDSSYYLKVAKFNNIVDFRNLEPGTEIIFPPIL